MPEAPSQVIEPEKNPYTREEMDSFMNSTAPSETDMAAYRKGQELGWDEERIMSAVMNKHKVAPGSLLKKPSEQTQRSSIATPASEGSTTQAYQPPLSDNFIDQAISSTNSRL